MAEKIVLPGDVVKTDKRPGTGLYTENGVVYSSAAGVLNEGDDKTSVEPMNPVVELHKGDTVICTVENVKDKIVLVKIMKVVGKNRTLPNEDFGVVRVMDIASGYTDRASDEFKIGDIIKAEVLQVLPDDVVMTTKGPNLGVIEGYCSKCRSILEMDGDQLVCSVCGKKEKRKTSRDYLIVKKEEKNGD
jgi:exosome complex component CSL4